MAHDLKDKNVKELAKVLKTDAMTVEDYRARLKIIRGGCPLQACCANEDIATTYKGGNTRLNFEEVNEMRKKGGKPELYDLNIKSSEQHGAKAINTTHVNDTNHSPLSLLTLTARCREYERVETEDVIWG